MPIDEFIKSMDMIISSILNTSIPYEVSIINSILDNVEIIYSNELGTASGSYMENYRSLSSYSPEAAVAVLRILSDNLKLLSAKNSIIEAKTNDYHKLRCTSSYIINSLRINNYRSEHPDAPTFSFDGRGCVYTVITGAYDKIKSPEYVNPDIDYILFTNNHNIKEADVWRIKYLDNPDKLDNHLLSRYVKLFPYKLLPEYDYSIYVDGNFILTDDPLKLIATYHKKESMLCNPHFSRDCIYDEAIACKSLGKDSPEIIDKQISLLRASDYPEHNGLIAGGFMVRSHHDSQLKAVLEEWWHMLQNGSKRDQLSFNYVAWKHNYMYDTTDFAYNNCPYIRYIPHL